jgi:RNA polymerase sigma-70 factor (ECF subfamily)
MPDTPANTGAESDPQGGTRTSATLLDRVRANEGDAWRRFVRLYSPLVYSWAKRCGLQNQDAADVLQEVFHAVAKNIAAFRATPTGSFRGWLWAITRNKVRDHFRVAEAAPVGGSEMQHRLLEIPEDEPESWSTDGESSRVAVVGRAAELIRGDFEHHTWQAFWRLAVENHAARDIATDLGMTVDAVYQAKARVLRRLREELGGLTE